MKCTLACPLVHCHHDIHSPFKIKLKSSLPLTNPHAKVALTTMSLCLLCKHINQIILQWITCPCSEFKANLSTQSQPLLPMTLPQQFSPRSLTSSHFLSTKSFLCCWFFQPKTINPLNTPLRPLLTSMISSI